MKEILSEMVMLSKSKIQMLLQQDINENSRNVDEALFYQILRPASPLNNTINPPDNKRPRIDTFILKQ